MYNSLTTICTPLQDIIVNFLVTVGIGCGGILSAYMASLWAVVDDMYDQAAILTRVTAAVAVSYLLFIVVALSPESAR